MMQSGTDDQQNPLSNDAQVPIGVIPPDENGEHIEEIVEAGPKRAGSSTLVLITLVGVSGVVLWGMRHLGTRGSINLVDISIDYPMQDGASTSDHTLVIETLQESTNIPQVDPQMIAVNPFAWHAAPHAKEDSPAQVDREAARLRKQHEQHMRALDSSAKALRLNSVMRGRVPIANISGELVAVGDAVAGKFTVTRIDGREVDVEAEGRTWTLTVGGD